MDKHSSLFLDIVIYKKTGLQDWPGMFFPSLPRSIYCQAFEEMTLVIYKL